MKRKSCSFSILAFALLLAPFILSCASTPPIRGADSKRLPGSVSEIVKIKLGGVDQWILLRGQDIANPVALYLHGGPGGALMPLVRHYTGELERHAIMAVWDQRGAGKSYSKKIPIESMKISQYLSDAHELVAYLKKRFNKKKIFLIGHSWGSILGMKLIQRHRTGRQQSIRERKDLLGICIPPGEKIQQRAGDTGARGDRAAG